MKFSNSHAGIQGLIGGIGFGYLVSMAFRGMLGNRDSTIGIVAPDIASYVVVALPLGALVGYIIGREISTDWKELDVRVMQSP